MSTTLRCGNRWNIRSRCVLFVVGLLLVGLNSPPAQAAKYQVTVRAERPSAIYKMGETARFVVQVTCDDKPMSTGSITYAVDNFITDRPSARDFPKGRAQLADGEVTVSVTDRRPEFLRCNVSYVTPDKNTVRDVAGVGFSPLEIQPSLPVPADFDQFWMDQKRQLAKVPMQPKLTAVPEDHRDVDCFDVQLQCLGGAPVSGYLALQHGAEPGSLPIVLWVHGAGVRSSSIASAVTGARAGMLSMDINAHGIPNGRPAEYYAELARGRLKDYRYAGRESRETNYFRGMFLRLVRAIDYLTSRPEWDGHMVAVIGHSQGGGQALVAGGLDPRVTFVAAGVPALCDHSGRVVDRINGWPKLVPLGADGKSDPKILEAARYFDAVNFASRCKADAILSVGFIDPVCPPASVYAAYNALPGKKQILNETRMTHAAPPQVQRKFMQQLLLHARAAEPALKQ